MHITTKTKLEKNRLVIIELLLLAVIGGLIIKYNKIDKAEKNKVEARTYIQAQMNLCYKKTETNACYKNVAMNLLANYSLTVILNVFETNEKKPEFFSHCHTVAHYLGQMEYKRLKSVKAAFLETTHACLGGAYHGAIEGYFMEKGIINAASAEVKSEVAKICGKPQDYERRQEFTECNHGLGHATMFLADYDLPKALNLCDATGTVNEHELCYSGALMANGDAFANNDHPTKYVKADDPLYPCPILEKQQQRQCYTYGVLTRFQDNLEKSIAICLMIPKEFQDDCFETIGRDRTMISAQPAELMAQCSQIKSAVFRSDCMQGSAYNLVIRFGINSVLAQKLCDIAESGVKSDCYRRILSAANELTSNASVLQIFCRQIKEEEYKNRCVNSINSL
ncbi:MAG TPA: hypothetical protein VGQ87_04120 [Patescibacteria group bacterium]|jgi:hypothetical protein|nr:hypothetical protein [Patescibacteria group bacterium]